MKVTAWILVLVMIVTLLVGMPHKDVTRASGGPRGYLTTPNELADIKAKADRGIEPYASSVRAVLGWANQTWSYRLRPVERCEDSDTPAWVDNGRGIPILYGKALAYHLTGNEKYAKQVKNILQRIMTNVKAISLGEARCRLVFAWGTPELVASADLIEDYWDGMTCTGPLSTVNGQNTIGQGPCKKLFQNWLVKNPYYVISYTAEESQSNWGAAATTALAYIADYLWDRSDVRLIHRMPPELGGGSLSLSPSAAYARANKLAIDRMNGYRVDYHSSAACDFLSGNQQAPRFTPVKSQITEKGIVPEDARRQQRCNIPVYNGTYQNYPQIHIGNLIQQCELMWRRGSSACYDNVERNDISSYSFRASDGRTKTTHLYSGRGSLERAINAVIIDSHTEWRHDEALAVAYRYYSTRGKLGGAAAWVRQINKRTGCDQDICFGQLTHGLARGETPRAPQVELAFDAPQDADLQPLGQSTLEVSAVPETLPTLEPTLEMTSETDVDPTAAPTVEPVIEPTIEPIVDSTDEPPTGLDTALQTIESDDGRVRQVGNWTGHDTEYASGRRYLYSSGGPDDALSLSFTGSRLDVIYVQHPALGAFVVEVDGSALQAVDSVAADSVFGARASFNLSEGEHTVRIYPLSGTIAIDAFGISTGQEPIEGTVEPPVEPTIVPPIEVTLDPTIVSPEEATTEPTVELTFEPTLEPTVDVTIEPTSEPATPAPTEVPATPEPTSVPVGPDSMLPVLPLPLMDGADNAANWQMKGAWKIGPKAGMDGSGWVANADQVRASALKSLFLVDLTTAQQPTLHFWQRMRLAGKDSVTVGVSVDGGQTWQTLDQQAGQKLDWNERMLDLSAYKGQVIRLRFRLSVGGQHSENGVKYAWWLDNLRIEDAAP